MNERHFHLRLSCTCTNTDNNIGNLNVEVLDDGKWQPLELSIKSPGFLLFINGLFSCQHLYMRANCAERGLVIESTTGDLEIVAGEFWDIKDATVIFHAKLKSGSPTEDDLNYIIERMKHCPVSSNLPDSIKIKNSVHFDL